MFKRKKLIVLAYMIHVGEDLLKCDLAETYHVYITDWYNPPFPLSYISDLANGLSNDSRIRRKIMKTKLTLGETLQAILIDRINILIWQKTKDGIKGKNPPESVYKKLEGIEDNPKDDLSTFETEEEYREWYESKMR